MIRIAVTVLALWSNAAMAQDLLKPVDATCISSSFGPRIIPNHPEAGTFHFGIDFPVPEGTPVWATAPGMVTKVQDHGPGGLEVLIQHAGFVSIYSHLGSVTNRMIAHQTPVVAGELVGYVGHTGVTFGSHLYFGMMHDGFPIDPAPVFALPRCTTSVATIQPGQLRQ